MNKYLVFLLVIMFGNNVYSSIDEGRKLFTEKDVSHVMLLVG